MARVKTVNGVIRDHANDVCENLKFLQAGVVERKPELAVAFLDGLRESLVNLNAVITAVAETYQIDLTADENESEVTESE